MALKLWLIHCIIACDLVNNQGPYHTAEITKMIKASVTRICINGLFSYLLSDYTFFISS